METLRLWCRWWPGLDPVACWFRYELTVVQRKPARKVISQRLLYASEAEIFNAIDLLGHDGYDFIWKCRSYVQMMLRVGPEDRDAFTEQLKRSPTTRFVRKLSLPLNKSQ